MIDSYTERVAEAHAKLRAEIGQQQELLEEFQEKSSALLAKSLEQNKEIERLTAACEIKDSRIDWTVADNAKKAMQIADLRAALVTYGRHKESCIILDPFDLRSGCNCGFTEALKGEGDE